MKRERDPLKQYISLRESLRKEQQQILAKLGAINQALGSMESGAPQVPQPAVSPAAWPGPTAARRAKRKFKMSPEARARIAEAARKRWAKARRAGKNKL